MADILQCDCEIKNTRRPAYWWKFVYEVLVSHNFHFVSPYASSGMSNYHYFRYLPPYIEKTEEDESVFGTAQDLLDEISAEIGSVIATFWHQEDDGDDIAYEVHLLAGGDIRDAPFEKAQARLQQFFTCCKDLFEVCQGTVKYFGLQKQHGKCGRARNLGPPYLL